MKYYEKWMYKMEKVLTGQLKTWMPRVRDGDREDGSRMGAVTSSAAEDI